MRLPLFLVAAIVLIVFAIIATSQATMDLFSVTWYSWLCASILAYFVDLLFGGFGYSNGSWARGNRQQTTIQ
jgi:uncharacterized integral membrane protein